MNYPCSYCNDFEEFERTDHYGHLNCAKWIIKKNCTHLQKLNEFLTTFTNINKIEIHSKDIS